MNPIASRSGLRDIVVEETLAHAPEIVWKALTTGALIARWLMEPQGFEPVEGKDFTFQTTPAGEWDGVIRCRVLQVVPNESIAYAWKGGHPGNVGYGSPLDTVVTWTLTKTEDRRRHAAAPGACRLRHADERLRTQVDGRGLEEGGAQHRRHRPDAALSASHDGRKPRKENRP